MATQKLGFWTTTSLVTGNMVGSGIFLLPAALANFGGISLFGWIISALGALSLAYVFASLARQIRGSGGPYKYAQHHFGDLMGYIVAWGYWFCVVTANAAIALALVSYLSVFIPILAADNLIATLATLAFVWILVGVNLLGLKEAGQVQLLTTLAKVIPLIAIAVVGVFFMQEQHFEPFNRSGDSIFSAVSSVAAMTMWAFLGLESANIPANDVESPEKNVPRAALLGTLIAACIYIPSTFAVLGLIAPEQLAQSNAPFADAAALLFGQWAYYAVAFIAVVSCFGTLNGWTLVVGQVPMAAAKDSLLPRVFAKTSKNGVPANAIILSSLLVSALVLMNASDNLVEQFTFVILLSTLTSLLPYLVCAIIHALMLYGGQASHKLSFASASVSLFAIVFSAWIIVNTGFDAIFWGCVLLIAGLPVYALMRRAQRLVSNEFSE
ncbi:amino acid permease [Thalassotalea ponticola]|uniref:amino acid permease n=1 Tax=Thalassotalea ponticola TaxID=1523392 RepID=UPI0025B3E807|nr:amino acid permease [Thalassotalea ponticola]MDN3652228.1 amino acid permease [Thalassotalea ponticola]